MKHDHIEAHDVIRRYLAGRLSEGEEREFEAHLVDCPACLDAVEADAGLRDGLRIVGRETGWQASPAAVPASRSPLRAASSSLFLKVAAVVLVLASIGMSASLWRSTAALSSVRAERDQLQRRARQAEQSAAALQRRLAEAPAPAGPAPGAVLQGPVIPAAVFALTAVRGSAATAPDARLRLDRDARLVVFSLEIPPASGSGDFEVSLKDRAAKVLWSGTFPSSSADSLGVAVERALLADGDYVMELSRRTPGGRPLPIGRYPFRVSVR